ncbi:MAG: dTDP-4-dehydrorhamnose 3,5-epimerase [Deltaproteobacteria bacterium]
MKILKTTIPEIILIEPKVFGDQRGFFLETYHTERYRDAGITLPFVQDNQSRSGKGVLRGLHFQLNFPQGKLVQVASGEVFDVAVDIRVGSPSFGKWFGTVLSDVNHLQMYIPPGFAHGFCVLSDTADFLYKCTDYYHPEDEGGVAWDDPTINIRWPAITPLLSAKDRQYPRLNEIPEERLPKYE